VRLRLISLGLLGAALTVHFGLTVPTWSEAGAAHEAYRNARDERRDTVRRLASARRRAAARARLADALRDTSQGPGDDVARLRRAAIEATRAAGVGAVRLEVAAARGPAAASLRLSASGPLRAVAALAEDLPGRRAVVLDSARLEPIESGNLRVELHGVRPGTGS
jgi:hypothetical protein